MLAVTLVTLYLVRKEVGRTVKGEPRRLFRDAFRESIELAEDAVTAKSTKTDPANTFPTYTDEDPTPSALDTADLVSDLKITTQDPLLMSDESMPESKRLAYRVRA